MMKANLEKESLWAENREAVIGLEGDSPLNLAAFEANGEVVVERVKRVFPYAEVNWRVLLAPLAAIFCKTKTPLHLSFDRRKERVAVSGLDMGLNKRRLSRTKTAHGLKEKIGWPECQRESNQVAYMPS